MTLQIGFTGTRYGMTASQRARLAIEIDRVVDIDAGFTARHGDCVGADAEFHGIVLPLPNGKIIIHPGPLTNGALEAGCEGGLRKSRKANMARNRDIVNESHVMFAAPPTDDMEEHGGTWRTIRLAMAALKRGQLRELCVIGRSGQILDHTAWKI